MDVVIVFGRRMRPAVQVVAGLVPGVVIWRADLRRLMVGVARGEGRARISILRQLVAVGGDGREHRQRLWAATSALRLANMIASHAAAGE